MLLRCSSRRYDVLRITPEIEALIDRALAEDLSIGDPTTEALVPSDMQGSACIVAKADGVVAGVDVALAVFRRWDPSLTTRANVPDGSHIVATDIVAEVDGNVASILMAERTALNFVQRLSGIATQTRAFVDEVKGHGARIVDTRKTTPGLRTLEKHAVRTGGGRNHRKNLGDGILIKDNHIEALRSSGIGIAEAVERALGNASHTVNIEIEVEDLGQVAEALEAGAGMLLLDNMSVEEMAEAVKLAHGKAVTEASGGITLANVREVAATGVDIISVGGLTHSVKALDLSLELGFGV
jgi:nicotinate-nucleotide pyrophosphorylase (carboxylating)